MTIRPLAPLLLCLATCGGKSPPTPPPHATPPDVERALQQSKDIPNGLDMTLTNGRQGAPAADHTQLPPATRLPDADADALLARLGKLVQQPDDTTALALRPGSQPAPRTGQTIKSTFPGSASLPPPAGANDKELRVLREMPAGKVPLAPELSITFSQPMVAVTSQEDAAQITPVTLSPTPKGRWRWIGTRTILFDPDPRFPQATTYQVTVPAGTKSASGLALKDTASFTFETPPPTVVQSYPSTGRPQHLDVPMFVLFDQRIDADKVLANIHVSVDGKPIDIRRLAGAELDKPKDKTLASLIEQAHKNEQDGRWVAFRATADLPKDASVHIEIGTGTPSAEGPNKTTDVQSFDFRTFPPLRVDQAICGGDECHVGDPFVIYFDNPLDEDTFDPASLAITPDLPSAKIIAQDRVVIVYGATKARTTYKVTFPAKLRDEFGQTLGTDTTLTFDVHDAVPNFFGPDGMVVLDPAATKPTLDFFTVNYPQLKVKLFAVTPADYDAWGRALRNRWNHDHPVPFPGKKVFDGLVNTTKGDNTLVQTGIDLKPALNAAGFGHAIAIVEPSPWKETYPPPQMIVWAQATKLGIDAFVDTDDLVAYATDLATGKPAGGVALAIEPFHVKGTTDDKGTAKLALERATGIKGAHYLTARRGDDVAFVGESYGWYSDGGSWFKQSRGTQIAWYVIDDRHLYKPGEDVTLKGILRAVDYGKNGDIGGLAGSVSSVSYKVVDARGNQLLTGSAPVDPAGTFDTKFTLPKTPNLGYTQVVLEAKGRMSGTYVHALQIEEFRRPEFEVTASASQGPFVVGGAGDITVNAKYFAGGPLGGAQVNWYLTAQQTVFTPPNREDYIFGSWQPWWGYRSWDEDGGGYRYKPPKDWRLDGKTDATGAHVLHLAFNSVKPALPMSVVANATVTDVNRQAWSASNVILVHPSDRYVGLKPKKSFVEKGTPFELEAIAVDVDGKPADGAIEIKAVRLDWTYKKGRYLTEEKDPQSCDPKACVFQTKEGGTYQVTATIVDGKGRPNQTTMMFWVSGGDTPPARDVAQERVQLIPDKKAYAGGDTAEILVQAPFYPAEGIVSWRRSGIVKMEHIVMTGPTTTLKVPITEAMVPNLYVQVDLVGDAVRTDDAGAPDPKLPKRPAYAVGALDLPIPPVKRTLAVKVDPSLPKLAPGDKAKVSVEVKDASGAPAANTQVAVLVVDEAILSLTGYSFPSPIDTFYGQRGTDTRDHYSQQYVKLAKPELGVIAQGNAAPGRSARGHGSTVTTEDESGGLREEKDMDGERADDAKQVSDKTVNLPKHRAKAPEGGEAEGGQPQAIAIRANFNPLAAFAPAVKTDAAGKATVEITMPDNLTRYRIVAIALAGDKQFGKGENTVTARLPLMVRPSPPRFLNFGDTFKLPVVVQNQTDAPIKVRVAVRATNATITEGAGREVSVPANDRVEVQFPAAAELAGTARFQIVGTSGAYNDAAELALPVWTPATTEAFATYGVIDDGVVKQPVALPGKVWKQFGGLEVTTASTNLQALTDAMLYLVTYPFECAEQRSSRILAIAALRDVLTAFKTKDMPSPAALEASVKADIEHLSQMQNYDGGFAFWDRGWPSEPYLTVYVASALQHAKAKGFEVPQRILDQVKPYLRDIEAHIPAFYPEDVRRAIQAYALYTRKQLGDLDIAKGQKLLAAWGGPDKLPMEANGWLLGLFAGNAQAASERKTLVRYVMNHVSETAGAANFTTDYKDGNYLILGSDRRVDGVMLESLIQEDPKLDLIPKVVTGLLAHRKAGRWLNTQENSYALLALDLYFQTYEKVTPDFVARVWLGNDYAGDHAFKGRTTEYAEIDVAMKDVATHDKQDLTIQKDGKGRLYYRVGMRYAPESLRLEPADYGFVVERRYEGADDPKDVTRGKDGVWHVKAGARVRVRLTMVNENRRYHVALVDPIPAGLEPMNPALAVTGPIPNDPGEQKSRGAYWWWYGPWYEHQNMRDERVEAFASLLWEGVHQYTYVARATTPGNFVVPPPKAEEMYMPETFGRGGSDRVVIE